MGTLDDPALVFSLRLGRWLSVAAVVLSPVAFGVLAVQLARGTSDSSPAWTVAALAILAAVAVTAGRRIVRIRRRLAAGDADQGG